jgi:hypothetical protein
MVLCEYLEMYFSHNTIPQEVLCYTKKHRNLNVTQLSVTHKTMYHGVVSIIFKTIVVIIVRYVSIRIKKVLYYTYVSIIFMNRMY